MCFLLYHIPFSDAKAKNKVRTFALTQKFALIINNVIDYSTAIHSTSTFAPFGSAATATQERAGGFSGKYLL